MHTDLRKDAFTRESDARFFPSPSHLRSSVSICGFNCFFLSLFVPESGLPNRAVVKGNGNCEQALPNPIKEKPRGHNSGQRENNLAEDERGIFFGRRSFEEFFQATGANHSVIVFGDAFAAEKQLALRATRHGLAHEMMETGLLSESWHGSGEGFGTDG